MIDPVGEVEDSLARSVEQARAADVRSDAIVIDPGIGFGKAAEESVTVLKSLSVFSKLGYPLLVGTSRKSFIRLMTSSSPESRIWGTAATIVAAIMNGAHIVRVHDVKQTRVLADVTDRVL
jgi:dihydropteroate synthase